VLVAIFAVY